MMFVLAAGAAMAQYTVDNRKAVDEFEKGQSLLSANPAKAFVHFEKALNAEPSFAEVHLTMAAWLLDHDSLDRAEEHLRTRGMCALLDMDPLPGVGALPGMRLSSCEGGALLVVGPVVRGRDGARHKLSSLHDESLIV